MVLFRFYRKSWIKHNIMDGEFTYIKIIQNSSMIPDFWWKIQENTGCLLRGVPEVLSNISLVFGDRDLVFYMKVLYYGTFDNQKMMWPISPTRYFKWLCQEIQRFQKLQKIMAIPHSKRINRSKCFSNGVFWGKI